MSNLFVLFLLFLTASFWGVGFPISKLGVDYIPLFTYSFLRFLITSILFSLILFKKYRGSLLKDLKENFLILSLTGLSGISIYSFFYLSSLKMTYVSNSALIAAFNPSITAILAAIIIKEKINISMFIGFFISLAGVIIIISRGSTNIIEHLSFNLGDIFMLIATTLWAFYSVFSKIAMRKLPFFEAVGLSTILGTIYLIPCALLEHGNKNISSYPVVSWISVLYMAIIATFFAYSMWYKGIEKFGAAKTSIFVNLVPVFGVLSSSILLKEQITLPMISGGFLVISGVILTNRMKNV